MATDWTHRIRLRNLRILLSLAQTRNLSHSAGLLNTTQPALSKWLRELEDDIGLTLFERHARGLSPTSHGDVLIAHARRITAQLDRASVDMNVLREGGGGRVAIGASGAAASEAAPRGILAMAARMPDMRIDLVEGTMDRLLSLLSQGDLDIVIGRTTNEQVDELRISSEVLYVEPIDLVARPEHPLFELPEIQWGDVQAYRWIVWPRHTPIRNALEVALAAAGQALPPNYIETNSVIANVALLNNSDLIGTASHRATLMLVEMDQLRIVPLRLDGYGSVSMYWRNDEIYPKSVDQALDCIRLAVKDGTA
ncbi:LysR family transcriptional regulator [Allopusillimonas soli]|uniref:LysR family transcriptional regulator n=1 Tax=Allopusillimonas soli TaxID=659016 RepID=A0A853F7J5_9BURK|nr:LysR substrate-binding domain-containing protein [Allopusillimonas soli]NYT35939.1 LysR family transcriptional regulator [Allopusillimonas soli]TEA76292.1 LysR family transcriptional regulator [Allopusillimonas soli]